MKGMLIDPDTGDLQVKDKRLVLGDNTEQIAESILISARGEFKEHPLIGAEIMKQINGNPNLMWCANAKQMLQACGLAVKRVFIQDNTIHLE